MSETNPIFVILAIIGLAYGGSFLASTSAFITEPNCVLQDGVCVVNMYIPPGQDVQSLTFQVTAGPVESDWIDYGDVGVSPIQSESGYVGNEVCQGKNKNLQDSCSYCRYKDETGKSWGDLNQDGWCERKYVYSLPSGFATPYNLNVNRYEISGSTSFSWDLQASKVLFSENGYATYNIFLQDKPVCSLGTCPQFNGGSSTLVDQIMGFGGDD